MSTCDFLRDYIMQGKENARTQSELAKEIGVTPEAVKHFVAEARKSGELIASCPRGYYYAVDIDEMQEFANTLRKQARTRLKTAKPFQLAIKRIIEGGDNGKKTR
jgi:predicted transcriptional regulator